jgi:transcriptional regulator with XRE-family HTH domain
MSEQPGSPPVPQWDTADRLRKALRVAGIGVAEMADYLGVSRTSVSNWINGRVAPSVQTLRLWALRCGVPYPWLLGGDTPQCLPVQGLISERTSYLLVRYLTLAAA